MYGIGFIFVIAQIYCIWHCITHRKPWWWILMILAGFGVIWYLLYEVRGGGAGMGGRSMRRARLINLNPGKVEASPRLVRQLEEELQRGDTVDLRIKLAEAHMELDNTAEAVNLFKSCLKGHHKDDPVILFGLAQSLYESGELNEAWNLAVSIVWRPHHDGHHNGDYFRPLLNVADNGSFIVNRK